MLNGHDTDSRAHNFVLLNSVNGSLTQSTFIYHRDKILIGQVCFNRIKKLLDFSFTYDKNNI